MWTLARAPKWCDRFEGSASQLTRQIYAQNALCHSAFIFVCTSDASIPCFRPDVHSTVALAMPAPKSIVCGRLNVVVVAAALASLHSKSTLPLTCLVVPVRSVSGMRCDCTVPIFKFDTTNMDMLRLNY